MIVAEFTQAPLFTTGFGQNRRIGSTI